MTNLLKAFNTLAGLKARELAMLGASATAIGYGASTFGQESYGPARFKRNEWISASTLQLSGLDMISRVSNPGLKDSIQRKTDYESKELWDDTEGGNETHKLVQSIFERQGLGQREYYIEDTRNKVFGYVDFMLNNGIPLEIKTTDAKGWENLKAPKQHHISQANFDAIASNSPYAYIVYAPRGTPEKRKVFTVLKDYGLYSTDVARGRRYQARYGNMPTSNPFLEGGRPKESWLGRGVNRNVTDLSKITGMTSQTSRIMSQKGRLVNMPVSGSYGSDSYRIHPNDRGSRAG